jgi:hypothetical protein
MPLSEGPHYPVLKAQLIGKVGHKGKVKADRGRAASRLGGTRLHAAGRIPQPSEIRHRPGAVFPHVPPSFRGVRDAEEKSLKIPRTLCRTRTGDPFLTIQAFCAICGNCPLGHSTDLQDFSDLRDLRFSLTRPKCGPTRRRLRGVRRESTCSLVQGPVQTIAAALQRA